MFVFKMVPRSEKVNCPIQGSLAIGNRYKKGREATMSKFGRFAKLITLIFAVCALGNSLVFAQQSFSCSYGKRAACLDYGDKVCSSYAKCVDADAECFGAYTCDYKGFVCKSKFDDVVDEYNDLLSEYSDLLTRNRTLVSKYNLLLEEYEDAVSKYNRLVNEHSELEDCVSNASTLDDASSCIW